MKSVERPEVHADWTCPDEGCKLEVSEAIGDCCVCELISIAADATTGAVWAEWHLLCTN